MHKIVAFAALVMSQQHPQNKNDWQIRPACPQDTRDVQELLRQSYHNLLQADYADDVLVKALPLITKANEELLACGTWYVAQHAQTKQIVGCGGWTGQSPVPSNQDHNDKEYQGLPHLRHFACHPDWTRTGVASAIWQRSLADMAVAYNGKVPTMEVFSTLTAIPFYEALGFEKVNPVEIPLQQGACLFPAMLMRRAEVGGAGSVSIWSSKHRTDRQTRP